MATRRRTAPAAPHPDTVARDAAEKAIRTCIKNALANVQQLATDLRDMLKVEDLDELHALLPDAQSLAEDIRTDIRDAEATEFPDAPDEASS